MIPFWLVDVLRLATDRGRATKRETLGRPDSGRPLGPAHAGRAPGRAVPAGVAV